MRCIFYSCILSMYLFFCIFYHSFLEKWQMIWFNFLKSFFLDARIHAGNFVTHFIPSFYTSTWDFHPFWRILPQFWVMIFSAECHACFPDREIFGMKIHPYKSTQLYNFTHCAMEQPLSLHLNSFLLLAFFKTTCESYLDQCIEYSQHLKDNSHRRPGGHQMKTLCPWSLLKIANLHLTE